MRVGRSVAAASPGTAEASVRLGGVTLTNGTRRAMPAYAAAAARSARAMQQSGVADGQVSSAVSQDSRACKQKSSSVNVVDETAACGAKRSSQRRDCIRRKSTDARGHLQTAAMDAGRQRHRPSVRTFGVLPIAECRAGGEGGPIARVHRQRRAAAGPRRRAGGFSINRAALLPEPLARLLHVLG